MFRRLMRRLTLSAHNLITAVLCGTIAVMAGSGFAYATPGSVTIYDSNSVPITVKTAGTTVGTVLEKQGIKLGADDKTNVALNEKITDGETIEIYRAMPVKITINGVSGQYTTTKKLVSDVLADVGITATEDQVTPRMTDVVESGDEIVINRSDSQIVAVSEPIPYGTVERENKMLDPGSRVVVQSGLNGEKEITYSIKYSDGAEVSRERIGEVVLAEPVDEIVEYSPQEEFVPGKIPASRPTNYSKMEVFEATAYDASVADNGPWAGRTSTGMQMGYGVIAVDPTVIPYGTKMYIESCDGKYIYGYAIAGDCGGAIKGHRVDLFYWSRAKCLEFGRRNVNVYFLD